MEASNIPSCFLGWSSVVSFFSGIIVPSLWALLIFGPHAQMLKKSTLRPDENWSYVITLNIETSQLSLRVVKCWTGWPRSCYFKVSCFLHTIHALHWTSHANFYSSNSIPLSQYCFLVSKPDHKRVTSVLEPRKLIFLSSQVLPTYMHPPSSGPATPLSRWASKYAQGVCRLGVIERRRGH